MHVYPSLFTAAGIVHGTYAASRVTSSWSQTIRDKEFLVEMRLRNLDAESERKPKQLAEAKGEDPIEAEE